MMVGEKKMSAAYDGNAAAKRQKKRILIVGGGFAGIGCARVLEEEFGGDPDIEIMLVSEDNFLLFTPMLPQVVSGMLETRHIVTPIRAICQQSRFYEGRVKGIDPHKKTVTLWGEGGKTRRGISIHYDYLVVALGSETNFFGMQDVQKNSYTLKTLNDAVTLRNRVIDVLEQAENETDPELRRSLLCFVVAGAGFAGIETAGELVDLLHDARKYYQSIKKDEISVIVLDALADILPAFNQDLAEFAKKKMAQRGIRFRMQMAVKGFDGNKVTIKSLQKSDEEKEETITTKTLVWTAGVTPVNTIKRAMLRTERGKIVVNEYLEVAEFPGVFAIGDCSLFVDSETQDPLPPTAQVAEAQSKTAAKNLIAMIRGQDKEKFVYKFKGQMAIIGKRTGIASIFGMNIHGFWAWLVWRNIYLSKIPSGEKRLRVLLDWTIDLFFDRDISRLRLGRREPEKEFKVLDEVDDLW